MESGAVVGERFKIERQVGAGGMGVVYRACDLETQEIVAVKLLKDAGADRRRFSREVRGLAQLHHPHIVRYIADGTTSADYPYLVMEWLEGHDLAHRLEEGALTVEETVTILQGTCEGLLQAHQAGIVHRDVKPSNLFMVHGDPASVKLLDFGVAHFSQSTMTITEGGVMLGTPGYMAPEQARGEAALDARADVFSLGCILYECLTGRAVFGRGNAWAVLTKILFEEAPRVRETRPEVPQALDDLVDRMLAKEPADRPRDARQILEELSGSAARSQVNEPASARRSLTDIERRVICVMLAKPRPANRTADSLDVDTLTELSPDAIGTELEALRAVVAQYGGELQCLADATLVAVFASSEYASDTAIQAARCALVLRTLLGHAPIALATGRTALAKRRLPAEVIERAADVLQSGITASNDGDSTIRTDDVTAALIEQRFELYRGENGHQLLGERDETDATRNLLGKSIRCVGRARELALLEATYSQCVNDPIATAILVTGAAGVGKSRLRYELLRRLAQSGTPPQAWFGRGDPMRAGSPFALLAHALRGIFGLVEGESLAVRRAKIFERVGRSVQNDAQRVAEFLGELCSTPFPDDDRVYLRAARQDPILMGDQVRRAWEDWLAGELSSGPAVLVLEDLQWGDLPSIKCIDSALRNLADAPLLVLALARPDVHEKFSDIQTRVTQVISLRELPKKACEDMVREALGADIPDEITRRLVDQAAGNALHLEELIRAVAEGRGEQLPDTVLAMLEARLSSLPSDARHVLRAASVFGPVFWEAAVHRLLSSAAPAQRLRAILATLTEKEWILSRYESRIHDQTEFVFRHDLLREVAYSSLTDEDRQLGHHLAAEWLEEVGDPDATALAEHFVRAAEPARAVAWYGRAAEQALKGDDLQATLARVERAVECGAAGETLVALRILQAEAHNWLGSYTAAETCAMQALSALPLASPEWSRTANLLVWAQGALGKYEQVEKLSHELAAALRLVGPDALCVAALAWTSAQLTVGGVYDRAAEILRTLQVDAADVLGRIPTAAAAFFSARGGYESALGHVEAAVADTEAAVDAFERAGDRRNACAARANLGSVQFDLGDHEHAVENLEQALEVARRMRLEQVVLGATCNVAVARARMGAVAHATQLLFEAADRARACDDRTAEAYARVELSKLLRQTGQVADAERQIGRARGLSEGIPLVAAPSLAVHARVRLDLGDLGEALVMASAARELCDSGGALNAEDTFVRLTYAEVLAAVGDRTAALAALQIARQRLFARADRIESPALRAMFLENVPDNAQIIRLAGEWQLPDGANPDGSGMESS
jgi:tetratricopeptide (TPR) repeat protein